TPSEELPLLGGRDDGDVREVAPDDRAGVGVAGVDQELGAFEAGAAGDLGSDIAGDADDVDADDHDAMAGSALDGEGFGPERHDDAVGGVSAGGVAGHPDG